MSKSTKNFFPMLISFSMSYYKGLVNLSSVFLWKLKKLLNKILFVWTGVMSHVSLSILSSEFFSFK